MVTFAQAPAPAPALSPPAFEVLGTLAACTWSGPHRAKPLRRWTRLTPAAFDHALAELAQGGLVHLERGDVFWVTDAGEDCTRRLFS
jgi:DNA-binding transcriptional ArsR family regulator